MKLFGENFEKAMFSGLPLKGGKFTGDQKIIKLGAKLTLDDVVLEKSVKEKLIKEVFNFFEMEPWYRKAGLPFKRGVALYGQPGTGKTMIAKILASTMPQTVVWVRAGDMTDINDMNRVFRLARLGAPSILFLEDIDFYASDRDTGRSGSLGIANMLGQLDGLEENDGILVIITTNRIETVEKAIIDRPGRIDVKIFIGELGKDKIIELLKKKLKAFRKEFPNWESVIPQGTLMTGAQTVEFSTMIMRYAISAVSSSTMKEMVITTEAVKKALKDVERAQNAKRISGFSNDV
jgi:ATP-dependent 26S proteasome regulatory subunit